MRRHSGFTLLELLITLTVITVLGMIAVTSYSKYTIRAYRTDAKSALVRLAQQEEKYYSVNRKYLLESNDTDAVKKLGFPEKTSERGYYRLSIESNPGGTGYLLVAKAIEGEPQYSRDTDCRKFTLDHTGKELAFDEDNKVTTNVCWERRKRDTDPSGK